MEPSPKIPAAPPVGPLVSPTPTGRGDFLLLSAIALLYLHGAHQLDRAFTGRASAPVPLVALPTPFITYDRRVDRVALALLAAAGGIAFLGRTRFAVRCAPDRPRTRPGRLAPQGGRGLGRMGTREPEDRRSDPAPRRGRGRRLRVPPLPAGERCGGGQTGAGDDPRRHYATIERRAFVPTAFTFRAAQVLELAWAPRQRDTAYGEAADVSIVKWDDLSATYDYVSSYRLNAPYRSRLESIADPIGISGRGELWRVRRPSPAPGDAGG